MYSTQTDLRQQLGRNDDGLQTLGGDSALVGVLPAHPQNGGPPVQTVSRDATNSSDPMAGRMSEVAVPGWYGLKGCCCCFCGRVSRCGYEHQFVMLPWCCWNCIPCCVCPLTFTNQLPDWDMPADSGTFRLIDGHDTMVWTSPVSWRKYGPWDEKEGTHMVKMC